jgi:hypothetical protein
LRNKFGLGRRLMNTYPPKIGFSVCFTFPQKYFLSLTVGGRVNDGFSLCVAGVHERVIFVEERLADRVTLIVPSAGEDEEFS